MSRALGLRCLGSVVGAEDRSPKYSGVGVFVGDQQSEVPDARVMECGNRCGFTYGLVVVISEHSGNWYCSVKKTRGVCDFACRFETGFLMVTHIHRENEPSIRNFQLDIHLGP